MDPVERLNLVKQFQRLRTRALFTNPKRKPLHMTFVGCDVWNPFIITNIKWKSKSKKNDKINIWTVEMDFIDCLEFCKIFTDVRMDFLLQIVYLIN